jgi:hypothetical protein
MRAGGRHTWVWVVAIVGGIVLVGSALGIGREDDDEPSTDDRRYAAFEVCKDFVRDRLVSPGSAVFRNYFEDDGEVIVAGSGPGPYTVRSTVDSQNGFGALLRTEFLCTVRPAGGDRWTLDDLTISE